MSEHMDIIKDTSRAKRKAPPSPENTVVLSRDGDFWSAYRDDAKLIARTLELVITSYESEDGERVPMAGIPNHALSEYVKALIEKGIKVTLVGRRKRE